MHEKAKQKALRIVGENVRAARHIAGLTQEQLAEKLELSVAYVSLIERGGRNPPTTLLVELGRALGVDAGILTKAA